MEAVRKENCSRTEGVLHDFLVASEERLRSLQVRLHEARSQFRETAEYFGECSRTSDPTTFFSYFVRFVKAFKVSYFVGLICFFIVGYNKREQQFYYKLNMHLRFATNTLMAFFYCILCKNTFY